VEGRWRKTVRPTIYKQETDRHTALSVSLPRSSVSLFFSLSCFCYLVLLCLTLSQAGEVERERDSVKSERSVRETREHDAEKCNPIPSIILSSCLQQSQRNFGVVFPGRQRQSCVLILGRANCCCRNTQTTPTNAETHRPA